MCPSRLTRTSDQVGSPWMLEGKMFLPETGMPIRKIACMSRPFALADPVPLTVPILNAKSFVRSRPERAMEPVRSGKAGPLRRRG